MSAITHRYVDVGDDLDIHLECSGEGPPLVLLHGFTSSARTWAPLRPALEKQCKVIAVDLPGHGKSSSPPDADRYRLHRFADDLAHVLDVLSIDRTVLLGYSMGGRAALRFAISHSGRLSALILESASSGIRDESMRDDRVRSDVALAGRIERDGLEAFVDYWDSLPLWATQSSLPAEKRARLREERLSNSARGLASSLRGASAGRDVLSGQELSRIDVPTLLIVGELDKAYVQHAAVLKNEMPRAQTLTVSGAGHAVHLEQPDTVASALLAFLAALGV